MKIYSTHWRITIFAAVMIHFFAGIFFSFALPKIFPKPKAEEIQKINWIDIEIPDDATIIEVDELPATPPPIIEKNFDFPPVETPPPNEPVYIEETPPEPVAEEKISEPPQEILKDDDEIKKSELEKDLAEKNIILVPKKNNQLLGNPPVVVQEFFPPKGSGLGFKGYVSVAVTIGTDGKIKDTKIVMSSERIMVDGLAQDYAKKWIFKPALDSEGKPMECDTIITFDFKKFSK